MVNVHNGGNQLSSSWLIVLMYSLTRLSSKGKREVIIDDVLIVLMVIALLSPVVESSFPISISIGTLAIE